MNDTPDLFQALRAVHSEGVDLAALEPELWERFGDTRAVLVSDSSGFTRTTQSHGILHFLACVARLRQLAEVAFTESDCLTWHAEADNLYAQFRTPDQALEAAFGLHQGLKKNRLMLTADEPFTVCIGIGYGRVIQAREWGTDSRDALGPKRVQTRLMLRLCQSPFCPAAGVCTLFSRNRKAILMR